MGWIITQLIDKLINYESETLWKN